MKKAILAFTVLFFLIASCGKKSKKTENAPASQDTEKTEIKKEIEEIDSTVNEMESKKKEIEESVEKVDELVNDL